MLVNAAAVCDVAGCRANAFNLMIRQRMKKNDPGTATTLDRIGSTTKPHDHVATTDPPSDQHQRCVHHQTHLHCYIFHLCSTMIVLIGVGLTFQKLYTHEECDMTWSQRQFIQVDVFNRTHENHGYKFFKFIDQRDPRYEHLQTKSVLYSNDSSDTWCSSSTTNVVVYVPGHGGSYQQSRSIGAHGVQLTQSHMDRRAEHTILQRLSLLQQHQGNTTKTIDNFFFDVYAFDFNEEGGALHGSLLERQATYMVHVLTKLSELCRHSNNDEALPIHIVAHSIGGISTRLALQLLNHNDNSHKNVMIQNVITLGTPHYMPVWSWDASMHNLYNKLYTNKSPGNNTTSSQTTMISISGGLRDEMIPPLACYMGHNIINTNIQFSVLVTNVMTPARMEGKEYLPPLVGVDHRAIVWCHSVLSQVRYILHELIHSLPHVDNLNESPNEKSNLFEKVFKFSSLSTLDESYDYLQSLSGLQQSLKTKYGRCTAFVMETSLLYNTEILVDLFAILGSVRSIHLGGGIGNTVFSPIVLIMLPPMICAILYYWIAIAVKRKYTIPVLSIFILAFLADAIFIATKFALHRYVQGSWRDKIQSTSDAWVVKSVAVVTILCWTVLYMALGQKSWFRFEFVGTMTAIVFVVLSSILLIAAIPKRRSDPQLQALYYDRQLNNVVLLLWILPPTLIGEVYAMIKGIRIWRVSIFLLPILVRLVSSVWSVRRMMPMIPDAKRGLALQLCRLSVLPCCWMLLTSNVLDQITLHPLPTLLVVATACDMIESFMT